ncbi:hypothetical protein ACFO3J_01500 [Streptomyces polygonati]|uniref:Uncharacterized protein n=1 Tax=Streptomyces polygonati TaxID=1617087 RepID=A0ABV8HDX1_9ACTN
MRNVIADVAPAPSSSPTADAGPAPADGAGPAHRTSVVERGAFISARCTCGWAGPARRARERARRDAREHGGG